MIKHLKCFILSLSLLCIFQISLLHAKEKVSASLDKNKAFIGDIIRFKVKAQLPKNAQISAIQDFKLDDFQILNSNIQPISAIENTYELNFDIAAYKTGNLTITPIKVFYINHDGSDNLFFTPKAQVEIISILANGSTIAIKDIKPLTKLKPKPLYIFLIVLAFVLIIFCIGLIVKFISVQKKESIHIEVDPKTKALSDLLALYENRENINVKNFYYKMSEILRTYVSKIYNFDAMEMTTSEFFNKIKSFLPSEIPIGEFKNYLKAFNLARYADFIPNDSQTESNYNFTKKLLELL